MKITITTVRENFDMKVLSRKTKAYTFSSEATKDDILDWFEDTYRDDSPLRGTLMAAMS